MQWICSWSHSDTKRMEIGKGLIKSMMFSVFVVKLIANASERFLFLILEELEGFGL